jgi:hypothetical protein
MEAKLREIETELREIHKLFLEIGESLMRVGTIRNMTEDWYAVVDTLIDRGITVTYDLLIHCSTGRGENHRP